MKNSCSEKHFIGFLREAEAGMTVRAQFE